MTPQKLSTYRAKRDFRSTTEPRGDASKAETGSRFVIQEHDATRLHWDLRLERDGVLASWAVPNGIPTDPDDNRKAIRTEDHPIEYLSFEGVIPKGEYGAGTMRVWDRGTFECEKWEPKKVVVVLHGERVRGRYALFEAGSPKDWMIHRMDPPVDPEREPMPERIVPMLARSAPLPRDEGAFGYELKWDGMRALVYSKPGHFAILNRNLRDVTAQYPELRRMGRTLGSRDAVLDGEIVVFDEDGRPSFARLQQRMHLSSEGEIKRRMRSLPVVYVAFDVLYLEGRTIMALPYEERRKRLDALDLNGTAWQTPAYHTGEGAALLEATSKRGLEGVVAKRLNSRYEPGRRSDAWIKVKNKLRQELVVGGWLPEGGRTTSRIGALLVGYHDSRGELRYAGRVGTGFNEKDLAYLADRLETLERDKGPFAGKSGPRGAKYVEPELVAEVEFTEWTKDGILRHPAYKGLCDLDPEEVVLEPPVKHASESDLEATGQDVMPEAGDIQAIESVKRLPKGAIEVTVEGRRLRLSNYDKVLYPEMGFTKGNLIEYYAHLAPVLLPHLHARPLTFKRYPDGVEGQHFYEKQCPSHRPDWVQTASIWSRHNKRNIDFCLVNDLPTLVWAGNLADIELHTSLSLANDINRPTMMVFDLDPGPPADIVQCCEVGLRLREVFDQLGLECFPKTSGSKGLQVYVPLNTPTTYEETKPFARAVAELLEKNHPKLVVSRMTKTLRGGKVLVDWSQNDEHKTTICVYSLRAKARPTVSTPLKWTEVEAAHNRRSAKRLTFDNASVLRRIEEEGDLFGPVLSLPQELPSF